MKRQKNTLSSIQRQELERVEQLDFEYIIGIDEVGLGAWAGPVVVAGVVLPRRWQHGSIKDSKQVTAKERERLYQDVIPQSCLAMLCLTAEHYEVDSEGLQHVQERLTREIAVQLGAVWPRSLVFLDGDVPVPIPGRDRNNMAWMPGADIHVTAVSAGSIVAKVTRDSDMVNYHPVFPEYDFFHNKGYHAPKHVAGLEEHGPCAIHRKSYRPVERYGRMTAA